MDVPPKTPTGMVPPESFFLSARNIRVIGEVAYEPDGRALAATLRASSGVPVRFVAVCAPAGACCPQFANSALVPFETSLKQFLDSQIDISLRQQIVLIIAGISTPSLIRPSTRGRACTLSDQIAWRHTLSLKGLLDTFRARDPVLRAFTYFSHSSSASRIDGVWLRRAVNKRGLLPPGRPVSWSCAE